MTRAMTAWRIGTSMWFRPWRTAFVTVDRGVEYHGQGTSHGEPYQHGIVLTDKQQVADRLSQHRIDSTAAGMAISRGKRMEVAIRSSFSFLFLFATALVRDGIREDERALETATGILKSSWYCPSTPQ